jgi:hypothetical protein
VLVRNFSPEEFDAALRELIDSNTIVIIDNVNRTGSKRRWYFDARLRSSDIPHNCTFRNSILVCYEGTVIDVHWRERDKYDTVSLCGPSAKVYIAADGLPKRAQAALNVGIMDPRRTRSLKQR